MDVFATVPDDWDSVSGAINLGEPLLSHSPKSKVRLSIQEIAARLHKQQSDADDKGGRDPAASGPAKKSLIGRIFANS
jgi:MinD-like ATPase involved in chromosome partitioning or flagellar assembly